MTRVNKSTSSERDGLNVTRYEKRDHLQ